MNYEKKRIEQPKRNSTGVVGYRDYDVILDELKTARECVDELEGELLVHPDFEARTQA